MYFEKKGEIMKAPLIVAGIVFALVALLHFARLYYHFPLVINEPVPYWANWAGAIVASLLSIWMFMSASCHRCHK